MASSEPQQGRSALPVSSALDALHEPQGDLIECASKRQSGRAMATIPAAAATAATDSSGSAGTESSSHLQLQECSCSSIGKSEIYASAGTQQQPVGLTKNLFDGTQYDHLVKSLNSAAMSSTGEEECVELLKVLDRLEARIFRDVEALGRDDKAPPAAPRGSGSFYSRVMKVPSFSSRIRKSKDASGAHSRLDNQQWTSPVSARHHGSGLGLLSASTEGFASYQSPEISQQQSGSSGSMSDPPGCSGSSIADEHQSTSAKRTARKLENSFVECSPSPRQSSSFGVSQKKSSSSVGQSLFSSWGSFSSRSSLNSRSSECTVKKGTCQKESAQRNALFGAQADVMPDVACRPFMLVSKASRHRPPIRRVASDIPRKTSPSKDPAPLVATKQSGRASLQCVIKDGSVNYNLWLEDTEELLVAKPVNQDISEDQEVCDKVFAIHSHKCKGKAKTGWMHWGKKDKPVVEIVGKLKVSSSVVPEMDRSGKHKHIMNSDYVLLEARRTREVPNSPLTSSDRRISSSSWDATPNESPRCISSSSESPIKSPISPQVASHSFKSSSSSSSSDKQKTPTKWPSISRLRHRKDADAVLQHEETCDADSNQSQQCLSYVEVAAVVTRVPIELKKRSAASAHASSQASTWENKLKKNEEAEKKQPIMPDSMSITVVLPAGDHGCPAFGRPGPQPLLERWRSGGNCDCGSWDLGCGLVTLGNQQSSRWSAKVAQDGAISIVVQRKGHKAALKLAPLFDNDTFSVSFEHPLSALQAFGSLVALLHTRSKAPAPVIEKQQQQQQQHHTKQQQQHSNSKQQQQQQHLKQQQHPSEEMKKKLPLRALQEALKIKRVYSLGCHPELTPVERV